MARHHLHRVLIATLLALVLLVLGLIISADPGSQADPLATVSYVQRFAQFQHVQLSANKTLQLGPGSEMVLLGQAGQLVSVSGVEQLRDRLLNLSSGEPVIKGSLAPFQHYLNASTHELQLRFGADVELWVRGVWQ